MANFGTHLAYPTPHWVAYRRDDEIARATAPRPKHAPSMLPRLASALRRFARAWVKAQAHNAFL